jgi:hypothetical protein
MQIAKAKTRRADKPSTLNSGLRAIKTLELGCSAMALIVLPFASFILHS